MILLILLNFDVQAFDILQYVSSTAAPASSESNSNKEENKIDRLAGWLAEASDNMPKILSGFVTVPES
ncbi:hypothetical protein EYC84_005568 [Monilinia fructicola]|uniref:Uncharacterized protein n=1 Tax=Monilinia fructicola TaxID=38448 RepID=A0A5M9JWW1_MONFR|nr:hypothetical protein EYC84_005568 [Monilinia fructicola]